MDHIMLDFSWRGLWHGSNLYFAVNMNYTELYCIIYSIEHFGLYLY